MAVDWCSLDLWPHQIAAIRRALRYLRERRTGRKKSGSALIRMPTGSGKTGVIAVVARLAYASETCLVVATSTALRDQLEREIGSAFWKKLGTDVDDTVKPVVSFTPSTVDEALERVTAQRCVLICTVQTLNALNRGTPQPGAGSRYERLRDATGYVVFDEGHREPAPSWARAVRGLSKPTVLFSATPYRNDLALFDVDNDFVYRYTLAEAISEKYVRSVQFHETLPCTTSAAEFVEALIGFYEEQADWRRKLAVEHARVIVRCSNHTSIREVAIALERRGESYVAVHERFRSFKEPHYFADVPDPQSHDARYWVHQYKLLEGIDDPRFALLAVYHPFGNDRSLVQQVGRVLRNPAMRDNQIAVVLSRPQHAQEARWSRYVEYESSDGRSAGVRDLVQERLRSLPSISYVDRGFRKRFEPLDALAYTRIAYRRSAHVRTVKTDDWHVGAWSDAVVKEWHDNDRIVHSVAQPDSSAFVIVYSVITNSPLLIDQYFLEEQLGVTLCLRVGDHVFFHDSAGSRSDFVDSRTNHVAPNLLARLFAAGSRASSISLTNSDLGQHAFRRRTLHAYSLADTAPGLVDHGYIASTIEGMVPADDLDSQQYRGRAATRDRVVRRYLGLTRGRVREATPAEHDYQSFVSWATSIARQLADDEAKADALFGRYATHVTAVSDPTPHHVLLDLDDILSANRYVHAESGEPMEIDERAAIVEDDEFSMRFNDQDYRISITFDGGHFRLSSGDLDNAYTPNAKHQDTYSRGLVGYINVSQAFRVVLREEPWTIFAHGQFYRPREVDRTSSQPEPDVLRVISRTPSLRLVSSEKGRPGSATGEAWDPQSVFGVLDSLARRGVGPERGLDTLENLLSAVNLLVCDDLSNEICDFIAVDTDKPAVYFIHAKHERARLSATALQGVCSQVQKNLSYLNPWTSQMPPNVSLWNQRWTDGKAGEVHERIRTGTPDAEQAWAAVQSCLRDPSASREVWIVLGGGLNLSALESERAKDRPLPQVVQIMYLLQSTWTAVQSVGARLRLFCPPSAIEEGSAPSCADT